MNSKYFKNIAILIFFQNKRMSKFDQTQENSLLNSKKASKVSLNE